MARTRWIKGMRSPNPGGRPRGAVNKKHMAIRKALLKIVDPDKIAEELYKLALGGDLVAIKYICDRLEGRPRETVDISTIEVPKIVWYDEDEGNGAAQDRTDTD